LFTKISYSSFITALLIGVVMFILACNPTRDRWINRKWHTLTGHYNVYFNGEIKFNQAVEAYEKGIQNDFNKILPVLITPDEATSKGLTGQMDEVIKKASASIQLHNVGTYTDDSYLLMGKAQFYKGDYFAALETFQYINSKYKNGDLVNIATAWIARCYDAMKKPGEAEAIMGLLINQINPMQFYGRKKVPENLQNKAVKLKPEHKVFIYAVAADIYLKQGKYNLAAQRLSEAVISTKVKPEKIRYNYILGQLYLAMDSVPQAKPKFVKVTRLLAPYEFEFNALLNLTRTYNPKDKREVKQVKRSLKRMTKDDKNEGFYDQIYYELARVEYADKDYENAIKHYKLSVARSTKNNTQKALSYLALGDIYLARPDYILGQAYYDSAAASIPKDYKDYQKIQDKKTILTELISNILTIQAEDSLMRLSKLSKPELEKRVDGWIAAAKLKAEQDAKAAKERKELEKQAELNKPVNAGGPTVPGIPGADQGAWYFYNASVMQSGTQEFFSQRKWGRRENEDFWRIAAREKIKDNTNAGGADGKKEGKDSTMAAADGANKNLEQADAEAPKLDDNRANWLKDVPFTNEQKKKSLDRVQEAYYNLGGIYDNKLKDYPEAVQSYATLLSRFPGNTYEPEVLYYLYKLYTELKQTNNANQTKNDLISKYPESNYALILQNKVVQTNESNTNKEVVQAYEALYALFKEEKYAELKQRKLEADKKFGGNSMQAKFDLLYALAVGKTDSVKVFKEELEGLVKTYPKTDVAQRAQEILDYMKRAPESNQNKNEAAEEFVLRAEGKYYYVFATKAEKFDMNELLQKLMSYNEEYHQFDGLRVNTLVSSEDYQLLYVRDFEQIEKAMEYYTGLGLVKYYEAYVPANVKYVHFVISAEQFKRMLKEKKIEAYHTFFSKQLPTLLKPTNK